MARTISTMKGAVGHLFRDRQILIRSDQGVRHLHFRRRHQVVLAGLVVGLVAWGAVTTLAYTATSFRVAEQAGEILDLEIGYARLITDLAHRRVSVADAAEELGRKAAITRHIVDRNTELQHRIETLEATLAERRTAGEALAGRVAALSAELASGADARAGLERRVETLTADAAALTAARDGLVDERRSLRAKVGRLEDSLAEAKTLNGRMEDQIGELTAAVQGAFTTVERLVGERAALKDRLTVAGRRIDSEAARADGLRIKLEATRRAAAANRRQRVAMIDRRDALRARIASLSRELGRQRDAQDRLVAKLRDRADLHIATVEEGLSFTGLDVDGLLDELEGEAKPGAGGPMIPPVDGVTIDGAVDLVSLVARATGLRDLVNRLPLIEPLHVGYRLSSRFGIRKDPITGRESGHEGMDFAVKARTPVFAPAPGKVVAAGRLGAYGKLVAIDHGLGIVTRYAHLSKIEVEKGQTVEAGDEIARVGSTGRSTGPHLHYEILVDGQPRNPANFLKAGQHVLKIPE